MTTSSRGYAPLSMSDEEISMLVSSLMDVHREVVKERGFNLGTRIPDVVRTQIEGRIESVILSSFGDHFGTTPADRFSDIFEQMAHFAYHMAKGHIFADGNKRTTMISCFSILKSEHIEITTQDAVEARENEVYIYIQQLVTGETGEKDFSDFLRTHSQKMASTEEFKRE